MTGVSSACEIDAKKQDSLNKLRIIAVGLAVLFCVTGCETTKTEQSASYPVSHPSNHSSY